MLKVIGFCEELIENIEFDSHIPFNVRFNDNINPYVNLWALSINNSVFEVAVDEKTGVIDYITLVNIEREKIVLSDNLFIPKVNIVDGIPICDLNIWTHGDRVQESKQANLIVGRDYISFSISNEIVKKYYKVIQAYIGVNELGEICEVSITDLSGNEMDIVRRCLEI